MLSVIFDIIFPYFIYSGLGHRTQIPLIESKKLNSACVKYLFRNQLIMQQTDCLIWCGKLQDFYTSSRCEIPVPYEQ